jgi:hypothetical protein
MILAEVLCDACSDMCGFFELWQGCRRVGAGYARLVHISASMLNAEMQEAIVRHEETLRDSRWHVAESRRLLELTRSARGRWVRKSPSGRYVEKLRPQGFERWIAKESACRR